MATRKAARRRPGRAAVPDKRTGGRLLITALEAHGAASIFLVPGESYLPALDALRDSAVIRTIVSRHEGGAAMMAEAAGKLTGAPGLAFATRGPGAVNAMAGVYVAREDATPMILFVGVPPTSAEGRASFQDIDVERAFSGLAKWTTTVRSADHIPDAVARAFHVAASGRPGPVVIGLPEDVLSTETAAAVAKPAGMSAPAPSAEQMAKVARALAAARRPMLLVGGPGWSAAAAKEIADFAQRLDLPIVAAFRAQAIIDNRHPCYVGHTGFAMAPAVTAALADADLVLAIGAELGEVTTAGHTLLGDASRIIRVHPDPEADGAGHIITATVAEFARALRKLDNASPQRRPWSRRTRELRAAYEASLTPLPALGDVELARVVRIVSDVLPENGIVTNGAGNYTQFVHRHFVYKGYRTGLAPASGYMGYGLPAAIAAKVTHPERPVVAFAGDGCFQMTGAELATAVQYALPIVVIVADNAMHGTIRMHQERRYPGRVMATSLVNPDFAALARSHGAHGVTVSRTDEFEAVFRHALAADGPTLIHLKLDPEAITPTRTLSAIRGAKS